jgi:hypothetical protein
MRLPRKLAASAPGTAEGNTHLFQFKPLFFLWVQAQRGGGGIICLLDPFDPVTIKIFHPARAPPRITQFLFIIIRHHTKLSFSFPLESVALLSLSSWALFCALF